MGSIRIGEGSILEGKVITKMEIMTNVVASRVNMKRINKGIKAYHDYKGENKKIGYVAMPYPDPFLRRNRIYLIVFSVGFAMGSHEFINEANELMHYFRNAFHLRYRHRSFWAGWSTESMHGVTRVRVPQAKNKQN